MRDVFEIMTAIRDRSGFSSENELPTRSLLRMIWDADEEMSQEIQNETHFLRYVNYSLTGNSYTTPARFRKLQRAWYGTKPCEQVDPMNEFLIGGNVNLAASTANPKVIDLGKSLKFFPTPSGAVAIIVQYFTKPVRCEFGLGNVSVSGTIVLDSFSEPVDDYYNDEWVGIYWQDTNGFVKKLGRQKVTDYVAATKVLTISDTYSKATLIYAFELTGDYGFELTNKILADMGFGAVPKKEGKADVKQGG